ncbi:DNA-directed RNA polymerase subunit beta [Macrococcus carouselicus]|uniref:DNA-directed RNA polymerase subunit beta n=1 Tax=Macrococcus carouselicus TaxID=69969 RepID=A0A9Q8FNN8_9STAP|nr:DNA-directed RNA polymerase subunit beta [Macrococcus carouselicus]TDL95390.1 DNA-directed RNA polymerase subunit beta [Macrococcus carouselicus]
MADYLGTEIVHRKVPLLFTILIVLALAGLLFIVGMMLGYGVLHSPLDVFKPSTWTHVFELTGGK